MKSTFLHTVREFISIITVEPVPLFYLVAITLARPSVLNLFLEKACRINLKFNDTLCDSIVYGNSLLSSYEEAQIQKVVAEAKTWGSVIEGVIPALLLLIFGSWSDRCGLQRPFMILPFVGEILQHTVCILSLIFFKDVSLNVTIFFCYLLNSASGAIFVLYMSLYNYVALSTSKNARTLRFGIIVVIMETSGGIGYGFGGIAYRTVQSLGSFLLCIGILTVGIAYIAFCIKDVKNTSQGVESKSLNCSLVIFDIKNTIQMAFRHRINNGRLKLCLNVLAFFFLLGAVHGEIVLNYYFVRKRLGWNEIDFSIYTASRIVLDSIGYISGILIFSKYLKIHDSLLSFTICVLKIVSMCGMAFSPNTLVFYLTAYISTSYGIATIVTRSFLNTLVAEEELGKVNAIIGIFETLLPFVFGSLFHLIYRYTVEILDGAFLLVGGMIILPVLIIFIWNYVQYRKESLKEEKVGET